MERLLAAPALLATLISVSCLSRLTITTFRKPPSTGQPVDNLSQIGTHSDKNLRFFRTVLTVCGILFAVTVYGLVIPAANNKPVLIIASLLMFIGNFVTAALPARGRLAGPHNLAAKLMAFGMLLLSFFLAQVLPAPYDSYELILASAMSALALGTFIDRRHFIAYELSFIYLSHITIVLAAFVLV